MTLNTGVTDVDGKLHAKKYFSTGEVVSASKTYDKDDFDGVFIIDADALVQTFPAVGAETAPYGSFLHFINGGADGAVIMTFSPNADDAIFGTIANAAADSISGGVDDKDFVNTKATANKGDRISYMSDGVTGWYITDGVGIFASEA